MIQRVYYQCPLGHYSAGIGGCWFDFWTQPELPDRLQVDVGDKAAPLTIADLRTLGVGPAAIEHIVLMDFGAVESAFDGMIPLSFMRDSWAPQGGDVWNPAFPAGFATVDGTRPVLYFRCNDGHYFSGAKTCPADGWCDYGMEDIAATFARRIADGVTPRPADLAGSGLDSLRKRIVIAQFGNPERAIRGVIPMVYHHRGHTYLERDLPLELL